MFKWILQIFLVLFCWFGFTGPASALGSEAQPNVGSGLDYQAIDDFVSQYEQQMSGYQQNFSIERLWQDAKAGKVNWDLGSLLNYFLQNIFWQIKSCWRLLGQLLALTLALALISHLQNSFSASSINTVARAVIYLALLTLAIESFAIIMGLARDTVGAMSNFLYAILPVLLTLLAALGAVSSVALFHPLVLTVVSIAVNLIQWFIFPLLYLATILGVIHHISPKLNVNKMAKLGKDIAIGALSITLTLFVTFITLSGVAGAAIDGLGVKAAKTATGVFVPVVGKSLADVMDTVLGTSLVLKNSIGLIGVLVLILICALPAIKILTMAFIYRLAGALAQPLGDEQLADALQGLGNSFIWIFGVVAAAGLLFFFVIAITVGMGNIAMMMR